MPMEGGEQLLCQQAGCPEGTSIQVLDLFYNTPGPLEVPQDPAAEAGAIGDYLLRLSLARPDIACATAQPGQGHLHTPGDGKLLSAIRAVYGSPLDRQVTGLRPERLLQAAGFCGRGGRPAAAIAPGRPWWWTAAGCAAPLVAQAVEGRP